MISKEINNHEESVANAFSKQAPLFDQLYDSNEIIRYKRERVRTHLSHYLKPQDKILELNCGTGEDAIYFATHSYRVHATDISGKMLGELQKKVKAHELDKFITTELCSYTNLNQLKERGPYDIIFSNFAGLNCTDKLPQVLESLETLLKPGGIITMVVLPSFCLWETLLMLKGHFKTAFRRFNSKKGVLANIEGESFRCWYYSPSILISLLVPKYNLIKIEGLCTIVPPSYIENFAEKFPLTFKFLKNMENKLKETWPFRIIGDYYIITFKKI